MWPTPLHPTPLTLFISGPGYRSCPQSSLLYRPTVAMEFSRTKPMLYLRLVLAVLLQTTAANSTRSVTRRPPCRELWAVGNGDEVSQNLGQEGGHLLDPNQSVLKDWRKKGLTKGSWQNAVADGRSMEATNLKHHSEMSISWI